MSSYYVSVLLGGRTEWVQSADPSAGEISLSHYLEAARMPEAQARFIAAHLVENGFDAKALPVEHEGTRLVSVPREAWKGVAR